jgi:Uma2 family endonuclease
MVAVMNPPENLAGTFAESQAENLAETFNENLVDEAVGRFVILNNVSWGTYQRLQADHLDSAGPRFTYDQGRLQIMSLGSVHEETNRTLEQLVEIVTEEMGIDLRRFGSTTFDREDLAKGFEPDSCFYIQRLDAIRGKRKLDIRVDPPPDLVIEIDISSGSLDKLPIFASVGVPEVWQFSENAVAILKLEDGTYVNVEHSLALPLLDSEIVAKFLTDNELMGSNSWKRSIREWVRAQLETRSE